MTGNTNDSGAAMTGDRLTDYVNRVLAEARELVHDAQGYIRSTGTDPRRFGGRERREGPGGDRNMGAYRPTTNAKGWQKLRL